MAGETLAGFFLFVFGVGFAIKYGMDGKIPKLIGSIIGAFIGFIIFIYSIL